MERTEKGRLALMLEPELLFDCCDLEGKLIVRLGMRLEVGRI